MAARKEILSDLNSKIADGNISDAYRTFEQLPVVDQIAVSLSPGVGDALAAYEVGEFGRRAKTNIQDQDRLGAAGNIALSALSGISLIPLFRFLRGAKAVAKSGAKAVDAPKTLKPPVEEPLPPAPSKDVLPEVEPFTPKPIAALGYRTGPEQPFMQSKVRKLLNEYKVGTTSLNKDLQTATPEKWVEVLQKNMPIDVHGELRLLNVLDEAGDIHPNLINTAGPNKEISRQSLDNYIARQQRDALNIRRVPEPYQPGNLADPGMTYNETQNLYFVRGTPLESGRSIDGSHYVVGGRGGDAINDPKYSGQNAYVFDGAGFSDEFPIGRLGTQFDDLHADTIEDITSSLREIGIGPNEKIKSVIRTQSDFTREGPNKIRLQKKRALTSAENNFDAVAKIPRVYQEANISIKDAISVGPNAKIVGTQRTELMNSLKPEFDAALRANDEQAMRKILGDDLYKTFTDTEFGTRVPGKFFVPTDDRVSLVSFVETKIINSLRGKSRSGYVELTPENFLEMYPISAKGLEDIKILKEIFKRTKNVEQIKQKIFNQDPSGYLDLKQQKEIQKKLARYTKLQNRINTATAKSFKETGSTQVSGSSADDLVELSGLRQDLGIDNFEISTKDIERITGKPFTESLPKSLDEIYYEINPATGRQKYFAAGPNPAARAKAYLDDVSDPNRMFMELANGVTIIKKAINPKITKEGFMPDPYLQIKGNKISERSNYGKLPIRARFKEAFDEGADGFHTGKAQLKKESTAADFKVLSEQYNKNENEIAKILSELGFSKKAQKSIKTKIEGTDTIYDGTYVKFTDELKEAIAEKGIDAFKDGGPVGDDDLPDVGSIEPFSPLDPSFAGGEYVDPRFGDPVVKNINKVIDYFGATLTDPISLAAVTPVGRATMTPNRVRELIRKVRISRQKNVRKAAVKELIDSEDLKLFKEIELMPIKDRLGAFYDLGAAKFHNIIKKVPENVSSPTFKMNNLKTSKPYTAKEIDDIAYDSAGRRLNSLFKTLEGGGNPARRIIREYPEVTALYRKSGREIPSTQPRPEYIKDYIAGKTGSSLKDGGPVDIDKMLAEL